MRLSTRRELSKLRELAHFFMCGKLCYFCHKPLSKTAESFVKHGDAVGPKLVDRISIHHINDDHDDNRPENKAACHTACHKGHHRKMANAAKARMEELDK